MKTTLYRAAVVIFMVYAIVMAVMTLQYFFDRGDMKKASQVIYQSRPNGKDLLIDVMARDLKISSQDLYCETQVESRYEGHVLVECGNKMDFKSHDFVTHFQWRVDVLAGQVIGENKLAQQLMAGLSQ